MRKGIDKRGASRQGAGMAARKVSKQTSARVSSIAGRVLRKLARYDTNERNEVIALYGIRVYEVRALAASALSQDEVPRKVAKRGKR